MNILEALKLRSSIRRSYWPPDTYIISSESAMMLYPSHEAFVPSHEDLVATDWEAYEILTQAEALSLLDQDKTLTCRELPEGAYIKKVVAEQITEWGPLTECFSVSAFVVFDKNAQGIDIYSELPEFNWRVAE